MTRYDVCARNLAKNSELIFLSHLALVRLRDGKKGEVVFCFQRCTQARCGIQRQRGCIEIKNHRICPRPTTGSTTSLIFSTGNAVTPLAATFDASPPKFPSSVALLAQDPLPFDVSGAALSLLTRAKSSVSTPSIYIIGAAAL